MPFPISCVLASSAAVSTAATTTAATSTATASTITSIPTTFTIMAQSHKNPLSFMGAFPLYLMWFSLVTGGHLHSACHNQARSQCTRWISGGGSPCLCQWPWRASHTPNHRYHPWAYWLTCLAWVWIYSASSDPELAPANSHDHQYHNAMKHYTKNTCQPRTSRQNVLCEVAM